MEYCEEDEGIHFDPTNQEVIKDYLKRKLRGEDCGDFIVMKDVYAREPWLLLLFSRKMSGIISRQELRSPRRRLVVVSTRSGRSPEITPMESTALSKLIQAYVF
ncbi:NAC domain [Arabidopsis thaliana x Arabidopsis arenosa]|uniref:NAC domain n=1 Tax=Arabidopsis thaliana x Arabidopsis arenosa TaxID=1240361 RepID=A0A8T1ZMV0_9BRAS|nr:NAC domain [Arabidopsis thaliana x Arabidopsis arenosa]